MLKTKTRRAVVLLLLLTLTVSLILGISALADTDPKYDYVLECTEDGSGDTIVLELYVRPQDMDYPILDGGSFALRFPNWMGAEYSFSNGAEITMMRVVPEERYADGTIKEATYHALTWSRNPATEVWNVADEGFLIGTYTFILDEPRFPSSSAVGKQDWLETEEAKPLEYDPASRPTPIDDPYNRTVWNPETEWYQGYYLADDAEETPEGSLLTQTDIGFIFTPPDTWKAGFMVQSYDPKKPMTITFYDEVDSFSFRAPVWEGADITGVLYPAAGNAVNTETGIGTYIVEIDLSPADAWLTDRGEYTLRVSKPGHLFVEFPLVVGSVSLSDVIGDDIVYLPCGDINPNTDDDPISYGDGHIKLNDRSVLMAYINRQIATPSAETILSEADYGAYLADLNGDGKITIADLNIMMAPKNYNKSSS